MVDWDRWARDVLTQAYPEKSDYIAALDRYGLRFDLKRLALNDRGSMEEASPTEVRHWRIVRDGMVLWAGTAPTREAARLLWLDSPEFVQALERILDPQAGHSPTTTYVEKSNFLTQLVEFRT